MIEIFQKELNTFFNSLIAYIVIGVFLLVMGLLLWVFPDTSVFTFGYADLQGFFSLSPYVFIFLIPSVTMRMFAEENRTGTLELLLTKPLTDWQIILGKYLSGLAIVCIALVPTVLYYITIYRLGNPVGNLDTAGIIGSYVGLILLAATFTAFGILSSMLSSNQVVAFIVAVFLCFIWYSGIESIVLLDEWSSWSLWLEKFGLSYHYNALSKGLLDSRNIFPLLGITTVVLMVTKLLLASRKW